MIGRLLSQFAVAAVCLLAAGVGLSAALIYFGLAVYLYLATEMSPPMAALVAGLVAIFFAVFVLALGRMISSMISRRGRARGLFSGNENRAAAALGDLLGEEASNFLTRNKRSALIVSLAAGFAVGVSPRLRHLLRDLL
jgi:hypothetical protein